MNKTLVMIVFCTTEWKIAGDIKIPCNFEKLIGKKLIFYTIVYNKTLNYKSPYMSVKDSYPKDPVIFAVNLPHNYK